MSQSPFVGSVTLTLHAKDPRAIKLGVPPRTLWSNDQDPVLLVVLSYFLCFFRLSVGFRNKIYLNKNALLFLLSEYSASNREPNAGMSMGSPDASRALTPSFS